MARSLALRIRLSLCRGAVGAFGVAVLPIGIGPDSGQGAGEVGLGRGGSPVTRARVCLQRDPAEPDADAYGTVDYRLRGEDQRFAVAARNLDAPAGSVYGVFLEDAAGSGAYLFVADLVVATGGRGVLALESTGAPPPELGGATFADLEGRRIQVRDGGGAVQLWALLPGLAAPSNLKVKVDLSAPSGAPQPAASASLKLQFKASRGCSKLDLRAKGLAEGPEYTVWIEDGVGEGTLTGIGSLVGGRLRKDTKKGDPLPFAMPTVGDLCGRALEIRDGGIVVISGTIQCTPAAGGTLVYFDSDRDGQEEIYFRSLAGGAQAVRLTNFAGTDDYAPGVSADGVWVAFSRAPTGIGIPTELWKIRSDGQDLTQLTFNGADQNDFPSFSPDGTKIVWSQNAQLWVMNAADGSNPTQLTFGTESDWDPSYNFDGSKIVFSRHGVDADIWVMDADGTDQTLLLGGPGSQDHPTWCRAPGNTAWIAFEDDSDGDDEIFVLDTGTPGATPVRVTDDSVDDDDPVFLVDGSTIQVVWEREVAGDDSIAYRAFPPAGPLFQVSDDGNNRRPATAGSP